MRTTIDSAAADRDSGKRSDVSRILIISEYYFLRIARRYQQVTFQMYKTRRCGTMMFIFISQKHKRSSAPTETSVLPSGLTAALEIFSCFVVL